MTVLGSGDGADVILASSQVDPAHAVIARLGDGAYLCDFGAPGGTSLNGRRIRWARLATGDVFQIGPYRYRVKLEVRPDAAKIDIPAFRLRNDGLFGVAGTIDPVLIVGSDPGCDVVLSHESVAPRHCLLVWTHQGAVVRGLHRNKGIRLNGQRVHYGRLTNGDSIGVGPHELIFETEAHPADRPQEDPAEMPGGTVWHVPPPSDPGSLVAAKVTAGETLLPDRPLPEEEREGAPANGAAPGASERIQDGSWGDSGSGAAGARSGGDLDRRSREMRLRVVRAQTALDRRAHNHREKLERERKHLKSCRVELQKQAERLLQFARRKPGGTLAKEGPGGVLFSSIDAGRDGQSAGDERERGKSDAGSASCDPADREKLQKKIRELTEVVRVGREEVHRDEKKLESLRFEIGRLRDVVGGARQDHQAQERELEDRFVSLERTQQKLRQERDELLSRIRRLDAQDALLETQIGEAERCRQEFEGESSRLVEAQQKLEDRQRELRDRLDEERKRLRAHQGELLSRTADLAKATREKRRAVEADMIQRRADLDLWEAELKSRRIAIETAGREELKYTAAELQEVINAGLGKIGAELRAKEADLDETARALDDAHDAEVGDAAGSPDQPATTRPGGLTEEGGRSADRDKQLSQTRGGRLESLLEEIESLQTSLASLSRGGQEMIPSGLTAGDGAAAPGDRNARGRLRRGASTVRLDAKVASFRDGTCQGTGDGDVYELEPLEARPEPAASRAGEMSRRGV